MLPLEGENFMLHNKSLPCGRLPCGRLPSNNQQPSMWPAASHGQRSPASSSAPPAAGVGRMIDRMR